MIIISGIYKIVNPKGKIYIGMSIDIYKRWKKYRKLLCKDQELLYNSLKKYGVENHVFQIIHELPTSNIKKEEVISQLNYLEEYYGKLYNVTDRRFGLNIRMCGGSCGKLNIETISKISGKNHWNYGKNSSDETRKKQSESKKGEKHPMYNKSHKPESIIKMKNAQLGEKNHNYGKSQNKESNEKRRESMKGRFVGEKHYMYGKKQNAEWIKKRILKQKETLKNRTQEQKDAIMLKTKITNQNKTQQEKDLINKKRIENYKKTCDIKRKEGRNKQRKEHIEKRITKRLETLKIKLNE